jgi:hypothetical protein
MRGREVRKRIKIMSAATVDELLHEAVIYGWVCDPETDDQMLVIGRRRPFIPCGADPAAVNAECARRFVVEAHTGGFKVEEIDPGMVVPFVDRAAEMAAADERANAVQRANVKPETKETT